MIKKQPSEHELLCRWLYHSKGNKALAKCHFDAYSRVVYGKLLTKLDSINRSKSTINSDMLHNAFIKMQTIVLDRPQTAAYLKGLLLTLTPLDRGTAFAEALEAWKTDMPNWIDRAMGFCQHELGYRCYQKLDWLPRHFCVIKWVPIKTCEQRVKAINAQLNPLLLDGENLLDWIGWQTEEDMDLSTSKDATKERSELIKKRLAVLVYLEKKQGIGAVDAALCQSKGAEFVFDTSEVIKLAPKIKIPTTALLYTIAKNYLLDEVKKRQEISYDQSWEDGDGVSGPDRLAPSFQKSPEIEWDETQEYIEPENLSDPKKTGIPSSNPLRAECEALLENYLNQARAKKEQAQSKLLRFQAENRPKQTIKNAEKDVAEAMEAVTEEERRFSINLPVFRWSLKIDPSTNKPYSQTFIASQINFEDCKIVNEPDPKKKAERKRQKVRDAQEDIAYVLSALNPDYRAELLVKLLDFLYEKAKSHGSVLGGHSIMVADENYVRLAQAIAKLPSKVEKELKNKLRRAEHKRWQLEERLENLCHFWIKDRIDYRTERQQLLSCLARAELGEREIAKRWKVDLEAVKKLSGKWHKFKNIISHTESQYDRHCNCREDLKDTVQTLVLFILGNNPSVKEIAETLGMTDQQVYQLRQSLKNSLSIPANKE